MSGLSRRKVVAGGSAITGLGLSGLSWAQPAAGGPPSAKAVPFSETVHGVTISDPYRWMEQGEKAADFEPFMRAQDAHARRLLSAPPGRAALGKRIAQVSGDRTVVSSIQVAGPWVFLRERPPGADSSRLLVRQGMGGATRVLVEPNPVKKAKHSSLDWWQASPDGARVVYGLSEAGSEDSVIHVIETASGRVSDLRIPRAQYASPSWLPDGSGFFYNQLAREGVKPSDAEYFLNGRMLLHRLGDDPKSDVQVFGTTTHADIKVEPFEFPGVAVTPGSRWAVAGLFPGVAPEFQMFVAPLDDVVAGRAKWTRVASRDDKVTGYAVDGDDLYLLTFKDAPRWRVVKTSAANPDLASAAVVVPQGARVIQSVSLARNGLYLSDLDAGVSRLRRLDRDGRVAEVDLPIEGSLGGLFTDPTQDGAFALLQNWVTPAMLVRADPSDRVADTGLAPKPPIDVSPYRQERTFATARDGAKVPVTLVYREGVPRDGSAPVAVEAYGSYGVNSDAFFDARFLPFLDLGGVLAVAGVRGGGEYGREWHLAGQKATKANTWRDMIATCEHLVAERWTGPGKIGIAGTSAGGITVGMALVERPELFALVWSRVGVSDAYRMGFTPGGPANFPEFGDPGKPDEFRHLQAMSAYPQVKDGARYPAVLLTGGMTDPRVPAWQPAKMAARLQRASASGKPVLLRVEFTAGHGLGSTRTQLDEEFADAFALLLQQTGHPDFQPRA